MASERIRGNGRGQGSGLPPPGRQTPSSTLPSPLMEASIKMAEQLGRTAGQIPAGRTDWWDEGFDAGQARSSS
jgi:hypothetical protein